MKTTAIKAFESVLRFVTAKTGLRAVITLRGADQDLSDGHIVGLDLALSITRDNPGWAITGFTRL